MEVVRIDMDAAKRLCLRWHYSNIFPPHCMVSLGFYDDRGLGGAAIWGWGTRPKHTIRKMFPSLDTHDYWELCRLCCRDDLPRNTTKPQAAARHAGHLERRVEAGDGIPTAGHVCKQVAGSMPDFEQASSAPADIGEADPGSPLTHRSQPGNDVIAPCEVGVEEVEEPLKEGIEESVSHLSQAS